MMTRRIRSRTSNVSRPDRKPNPDNLAGYQPLALIPHEEGHDYTATIPAAVLTAGQTAPIYYFLTALDNDDLTGSSCDHEMRYPKNGHFSFVATD